MSHTIPNFVTYPKQGIFLFMLCMLLAFQRGNAQHCFPGFHISVDGNTFTFDDQSTADGTIVAYSWDFGDGQTSADQNPVHTYSTPGTYNVCLTITAHNPDCTNTYCHHVVVVQDPPAVCHAAFTAHQPDPAQQTLYFTDQSTSDGDIGSWSWDFGDGTASTEQNPSHTYAAAGTYLVCLVITDDDGVCTSHVCQHVVVHHPVVVACHAAFTLHVDGTGFGIQFTNTSAGTTGSTAYQWEFGDGATSSEENPHHIYADPGHYLVCLFIEDAATGCSSHVCHNINVDHGGDHHFDPHQPLSEAKGVGKNDAVADRNLAPAYRMDIYPNPAVHGAVSVVYQIPATAGVKFEIYNMTGARVVQLAENERRPGAHTEVIRVDHLLPGEYVLKMTVDGIPHVRRVMVQ